MIIGNGTSDTARSNAFTVDWNGNVECGTINSIDVTQLSSGGSGVGQVDTTEGATYHGEIFNSYPDPDSHYVNSATGQYSHAEGFGTTASGDTSHAEGASTKASGNNSHAEGASTKASGQYSHAEGNGTTASGERSHAEGSSTTASSNCAHAEGSSTTASGDTSHAEGSGTTASGYYSHAEGYETTASGERSHAEGFYTKASSDNQHVQGKFNVEDTANKYAMIIGNGYTTFNTETSKSETIRSNAFTVDWNGNIQCGKTDTSGNFTAYGTINGVDITQISSGGGSGVGQRDGSKNGEIFNAYSGSGKNVATGSYAHAEGYKTSAIGSGSHAEGNVAVAYGQNSHAEGYYTYAAISEQHVQGRYNVKDTDGVYAMIIGNGTGDDTRSNRFTVDWDGNIQCGKTDINGNFTTYGTINGVDVTQLSSGGGVGQTADGAVVNGEIFNDYTLNKATANYAHAEGSNATASGTSSHAEGSGTTASGHQSHAEGQLCIASGNYSHAEGQNCVASGTHSHAEGCYTKASSNYQHVSGMFNVEDTAKKYAMIIGNGTEPSGLSNALTVDWNGNIQCGKTDSSGNFTTHGTINGIDIVALAARVAALEGSSS